MKTLFFFLLPILLLTGVEAGSAQTNARAGAGPNYGCLPRDVNAQTVVEEKQIKWRGGIRLIKETVEQRLNKLHARCKAGRLLDQKGKEIRFYRLDGCWGNPPADYLDILEAEREKLRDLRKKFTVIEIMCSGSGIDLI